MKKAEKVFYISNHGNKKNLKKLSKLLLRIMCFKCYQKCYWSRHIVRPKHLTKSQGNTQEIKKLEKTFKCECGKQYKTNSGL